MPLTNATDDEAFIAEISQEMEAQARRNREHNAAMIEEYLRRRLQAAEATMKEEMAAEQSQMQNLVKEAEAGKADAEQKLAKASATLQRLAVALGRENDKLPLRRSMHQWITFARRRTADRERASELAKRNTERIAHHAFLRLSHLVVARRCRKESAAEATRLRCEVEELMGQIDVFKEQLQAEREYNTDMDERLKAAFLRGVSAVNREAMQVLRGGAEGGDGDVTAIEEILSGGGGNTRGSSAMLFGRGVVGSSHDGSVPTPTARAAAGVSTDGVPGERHRRHDGLRSATVTGAGPDICPVHHTDAHNNFYHRCYAPASCAYGPHGHPGPAGGGRTSFVVRGNLNAAPSYVAGAPTRSTATRASGSRKLY